MSKFKEPFQSRIVEALDGAVSVCWCGCHKIYICLDEASHEQQVEYGYEMVRFNNTAEDRNEALKLLRRWYDYSCGLRFVNTIENKREFNQLIAQFEYDKTEEDDDE